MKTPLGTYLDWLFESQDPDSEKEFKEFSRKNLSETLNHYHHHQYGFHVYDLAVNKEVFSLGHPYDYGEYWRNPSTNRLVFVDEGEEKAKAFYENMAGVLQHFYLVSDVWWDNERFSEVLGNRFPICLNIKKERS